MFRKVGVALRANIFLGLAMVTPIVVTAWVTIFLYKGIVRHKLIPISRKFVPFADNVSEALLAVFSILLMLAFLYMVGMTARLYLGKRLYHLGDTILSRIPFVRDIYIAVRQISESFIRSRKSLFREVVVIEYPRKGLYSLAFVTSALPPGLAGQLMPSSDSTSYVCLFVPTTPNPTSGFFIMAPREEVMPAPLSVGQAVKLVMSTGFVIPGPDEEGDDTLLDRLRAWIDRAEAGEAAEPDPVVHSTPPPPPTEP